MIPEPSLIPPEHPEPPLRCCLCGRPFREALELSYGLICRRCLLDHIQNRSFDDTAALLCAPIIEGQIP